MDDRRRDRKRKKREQHKKQQSRRQKKQEPQVRERRHGTSDPVVAVCVHESAVPVGREAVREAWEALRAGRVVDTRPAPEMGRERMCWDNVRRLVGRHGGEMALGWSVVEVPLRDEIPAQQNRFAPVALNAHAVWLQNGRYYETCPERVRLETRFLPTGEASVVCDACIEFFDSAGDAEAADWPVMSINMRPLALLAVELRSPAPGNDPTDESCLAAGITGEVYNAAGKVALVIPAEGIEGAIRFEIDAIHPAGVPAGNPGWVQVLIDGSEYCRISPELCLPPYHRLADCVMIAHLHRERFPLGAGSAAMRVLPPHPHPEAREVVFWRERLIDGEVVMVDTPERIRRMGGRC